MATALRPCQRVAVVSTDGAIEAAAVTFNSDAWKLTAVRRREIA